MGVWGEEEQRFPILKILICFIFISLFCVIKIDVFSLHLSFNRNYYYYWPYGIVICLANHHLSNDLDIFVYVLMV